MNVSEALRNLPALEAAAVRMAYGLVSERPYQHTDREIGLRLEVTTGQARMLREAGLYKLMLRNIPHYLFEEAPEETED